MFEHKQSKGMCRAHLLEVVSDPRAKLRLPFRQNELLCLHFAEIILHGDQFSLRQIDLVSLLPLGERLVVLLHIVRKFRAHKVIRKRFE